MNFTSADLTATRSAFRWFLIPAFSFFFMIRCVTGNEMEQSQESVQQEQAAVTPEQNELQKIKENYRGYDCFAAQFSLTIKAPGRTENGKALLRADQKNSRMNLILRDAVFGIEVIRVVMDDESVLLWNLREGKQFRIPVESFELHGLGNNSIHLPFALFKNFLFATLPEELFATDAGVTVDGEKTTVAMERGDQSYFFTFQANRLQSLLYRDPTGQRVDVALTGAYAETLFPREIGIGAGFESETGFVPSEQMQIRFTKIDLQASCEDRFFTMPR